MASTADSIDPFPVMTIAGTSMESSFASRRTSKPPLPGITRSTR